ncbi:MAG: hypothetical protein JWM20_15 [Patescibacteria group bacterium]|nr:hypothetical protein [Patescibacteria group bacterium]
MKYKDQIEKLFQDFVGADAKEEVWKEWVRVNGMEVQSLRELLKSDVHDRFKARALMILLIPDFSLLPFHWKDSGGRYIYIDWFDAGTFSENLQNFLAEFACLTIDCDPKQGDDAFKYNDLIIRILEGLEETSEWAAKLFERFLLNDPEIFWNMETASGYNPFRDLLSNEKVSLKWKRLADQQMHSIIIGELDGILVPRKDFEFALRCYTDHIQMMNYDGKVGYPRELFVEQISFLMSTDKISKYPDRTLFSSWQLGSILSGIPGEKHKDLRHKLARHELVYAIGEHGKFSVLNEQSEQVAHEVFEEFGPEDLELAQIIEKLISERLVDKRTAELEAVRKNNEKEQSIELMR